MENLPVPSLFLLISFMHTTIPICYNVLAVSSVSLEIFYRLSEYICLMLSWEMWQINYVFMANEELWTELHWFRLVLSAGWSGDLTRMWLHWEAPYSKQRSLGWWSWQQWSTWSKYKMFLSRCLTSVRTGQEELWGGVQCGAVVGQSSWFTGSSVGSLEYRWGFLQN